MDRSIVYPGSIPLDTDILLPQQRAMVAIGYALRAVMGTATVVDGLACNPTAPASMQVVVSAGSIITEQALESTDFGSVGADLGDTLVKMGINVSASTFTLTAPSVSGQSQNYLIQAQFSESDGTPVVLPYVNSSNPSQPFSGPNNSGTPQNTARKQAVALQLKAGAPANAGTQVTPPADTGAVALYVITVNFGQASITAQSISQAPGAPFIKTKLPQLAPLLSPAFTGAPTAPTPNSGDNSTKIATTAFVQTVTGGAAPGSKYVHAGGGAGQDPEGNHNIILGWNGVAPKVQVDSFDAGEVAMMNLFTASLSAGDGWLTIGTVSAGTRKIIVQYTNVTAHGGGGAPYVTNHNYPITFPNVALFVIANFDGSTPPLGGSVAAGYVNNSTFSIAATISGSSDLGVAVLAIGY